MARTASNSFQEYAWFSVQVDQYYAAVRIFARHYDALKIAYNHFPGRENWPKDTSCLTDAARAFFVRSASAFNYMGTTGIFEDAPYSELRELPNDMVNFGFYTCLCFQWTLFENFVKQSINGLADDGLLARPIVNELRKRELRTKAFLKYIDDGHVFGHTPFTSVLPIVGWVPQFQDCAFADLDSIREQRNEFMHAVEDASILPGTEIEKERLYERSMSILRLFAGNIDQDGQNIRGPIPPQSNKL